MATATAAATAITVATAATAATAAVTIATAAATAAVTHPLDGCKAIARGALTFLLTRIRWYDPSSRETPIHLWPKSVVGETTQKGVNESKEPKVLILKLISELVSKTSACLI